MHINSQLIYTFENWTYIKKKQLINKHKIVLVVYIYNNMSSIFVSVTITSLFIIIIIIIIIITYKKKVYWIIEANIEIRGY